MCSKTESLLSHENSQVISKQIQKNIRILHKKLQTNSKEFRLGRRIINNWFGIP